MKEKNNRIGFLVLKYFASLFFAGIIIWILFRNQDPVELIQKISEVDFKWVILSMIFGACAYISRGLRWIILIDALGYKSSKINSISSVSIGYLTNLFIPRAGEISRCTALHRTENIPVDKLLGTILVERVIDFVFLIALFLFTTLLKFDLITNFFDVIFKSSDTMHTQNSDSSSAIGYMILIGVFLFFVLSYIVLRKKIKNTSFYIRILKFIEGLKEGFKSIRNMKKSLSFWAHTFSIWAMYFLMTYICFYSIQETSHLQVSDGLFLLVLGGIGMVIPVPGGIGAYHGIVMIGLSLLGVGTMVLSENGDPSNPALLFPTIVHTAQTLVAIILGSLGLIILFLSKKKVNNE